MLAKMPVNLTQFPTVAALLAVSALVAACGSPEGGPPPSTGSSGPTVTSDPACPPSGTLSYVCGPSNAEDLVPVGTTRWLVASNGAPEGVPAAGKIYLIDTEAKTSEELFPGASPVLAHDAATYPDCPTVDLTNLEVHGIALRETASGKYRLYATTHGAVEAIQAWELDATGDRPSVVWVGCVPLPPKMYSNGVAILADGGFVTTKFIDPTEADPFASIGKGQINGEVHEWHPGGAVTAVPGTELSGANGIEVSADGGQLFVAAYGTHEVVRYDVGPNPGPPARIALDIAPDNLRWTEAGTLLTIGANLAEDTGWTVVEIDPATMTASPLTTYDQDVTLQNASTALRVGKETWIGTWDGDRVGYYSTT